MSFNTIPAFSMSDIQGRDAQTIAALKLALTTHGFFTITDHGISDEILQSSYKFSKDFFLLPKDVKNAYAHPDKAGARGYTPFGKETAVGEKTPDLKEFWHHGPSVNETYDPRIAKNITVSEILDFNNQFDILFNQLNLLGMKVLSAIAIILDKEPSFFDSWVTKGNSVLRLIHYPPVDDPSNVLRARAHEDINLITLLLGTQQEGLEVLDKNNNWIPIETNSDIIVCNVGDMLQRLTNHRLKSTTHKVINPMNSNKNLSRYSMPFFVHLNPDFLIKTLPQCINNEHPDLYPESILANDYLNMRLKEINLK